VSETPPRTLPLLDADNTFFWTSGADGRLRFLRCRSCGYYIHPPSPRCPECGGTAIEPEIVSGAGRVFSYTINRQPWDGHDDPYVIAIVELIEQSGLRLTTNIVGCDVAGIAMDMPVRVIFEDHDPVWIPLFRPEAEA
jgi:uncharacterized protein